MNNNKNNAFYHGGSEDGMMFRSMVVSETFNIANLKKKKNKKVYRSFLRLWIKKRLKLIKKVNS